MRRAIAVHPRGRWPQEEAIDRVTLAFDDRHRRRIHLVADSGREFLLDLPRVQRLCEGDGLELAGGGYIRVHSAAEPVIAITAADAASLLRIAWHLGNRHLPLQVEGERLFIGDDPVIAGMVTGLGGRISRRDAPFDPEIGAYAGYSHDGHSHAGHSDD